MATTVAEYLKIHPGRYERMVGLGIITRGPWIGALPLVDVAPNMHSVFQRESTLGTAQSVAIGALASDSAGARGANVTLTIKEFTQFFRLPDALTDTLPEAIRDSTKSLNRLVERELIHGDDSVTTTSFDGIDTINTGAQVFQKLDGGNTSGQTLTLAMIRQLVNQCKTYGEFPGPVIIVAHPYHTRKIEALLDAAGGTTPAMQMVPNFGQAQLSVGSSVSGFSPVVANEWVGCGVSTLDNYGSAGASLGYDFPSEPQNQSLTTVNDGTPQADTTLTVTSGAALTAGRYYVCGATYAEALTRNPWKAVSISTNDVTLDRTPSGTGVLDIDDSDNIYAADVANIYAVHLHPEAVGMVYNSNKGLFGFENRGPIGDDTQGALAHRYASYMRGILRAKSLKASATLKGIRWP